MAGINLSTRCAHAMPELCLIAPNRRGTELASLRCLCRAISPKMATEGGNGHPASHHATEPPASSSETMWHAALLYAICLTLVGFILPLSSFVALTEFPAWSLAGFYIGIYTLAIVFLIFFVVRVARCPPISVPQLPPAPNGFGAQRNALPTDTTIVQDTDGVEQEYQTPSDQAQESGSTRRRHHLRSSGTEDPPAPISLSTLLRNAQELGVREIPACPVLSQEDSHAPSFFMRVACFIFGSLKVTHDTLMIVDTLTDVSGGCADSISESAGLVIQYLLSISFTVLQTFFIFKYCKVSVNVYRNITTIGFMHLAATNLCDWFLATLMETSYSSYKSSSRASGSSSYSSSGSSNSTSTCSKDVFWRMAPYLLPFTIEYALMAAVSAYALCQNVGRISTALHQYDKKRSSALMRCLRKCRDRSLGQSQMLGVSCVRTGRGVIVGAVLFIGGLVSGIYFTIYISDKPVDSVTSQLIYQVTDLVLLAANFVLCIVAYWKMRRLSQPHGSHESGGPDAWLLGITLIGSLAFQMYQLFGSGVESGSSLGLRVAQALLAISQSIFQVFLIFEVEHRRCATAHELQAMPGREELAALMLGNVSLWIVYTLEIREIPSLSSYGQAYASIATKIITYSCSPLIIFFRFHSACCFVEIWRTAYRVRRGALEPEDGSHGGGSAYESPDRLVATL